MKTPQFETLVLDTIVGGGQTIGTLADGRKAFVWGGLPGETVAVRVTKKKARLIEAIVTEVHQASSDRITPADLSSYLSTSPWQIMSFEAEQHYKAALIEEAFELHDIVLPQAIDVYSDNQTLHYRNKVEFSWFGSGEDDNETLDLAFFQRGSKGKIIVDDCSLLPEPMIRLARAVRDLLQAKPVTARNLKTLLIRCDRQGNCVWQLYLKDKLSDIISPDEAEKLPAQGGEVIYSDPRSPASRITERLAAFDDIVLTDKILGVPFRYATEGFFQVNLPVYEQALLDMKHWVNGARTVDMYSGVGTIGLTIGGEGCILVEVDEHAVREMKRNIAEQHNTASAVLAPSERALDYITADRTIIVDPPRAGLHADVVERLLSVKPKRIVYLSCNPVTQARDVARLSDAYGIRHHRGYNFFPRTPHIEHLVVLELLP